MYILDKKIPIHEMNNFQDIGDTLVSIIKQHKRKYFLKCKAWIITVHVQETYKRLQF